MVGGSIHMQNRRSIAEQVREARKKLGWTQSELAARCRLDIRTIQRIESGEVSPRSFTLRLINEALGKELVLHSGEATDEREQDQFRRTFRRRRRIRLILAASAMAIMAAALVLLLTDIPRIYWAPFVYGFMFMILFGIGLTWRCPSCNAILGDVFNTRYCSKCGLHFYP